MTPQLEKVFLNYILNYKKYFDIVKPFFFRNSEIQFVYGVIRDYMIKSSDSKIPSPRQILDMVSLEDKEGIITKEILKSILQVDLKEYDEKKVADVNFTGSGATVTDNLGRFTFLSVMPGSVNGKKPVVMFRVLHKGFNGLNTVMYFPDVNNPSGLLNAKKEGEIINNGSSEVVYSHLLTLDGQNHYLQY